MTYDSIVKQAFLEELGNIYAARGEHVDVDKLASDPRIDAMIKEAKFLQAIKKGLGQAGKAVHRTATPAGRQLAKYEKAGVGDVAGAALKKQNPLRRAEAWGKTQRQTPIARVATARKAATSPTEKAMLTVSGDKASKMKQMGELNKATQQIGGTSTAKQMMGAGVEGAASHVRHKPLMAAINPLGAPIGGAIEGVTRQAGRGLSAAGHKGAGGALKRHAGKAGLAGEIGALAGMGTAVHAPLSAAGLLGGKISGGVAAAAPALADVASHAAEPIGHAGKVLAHGAEDAIGMATKKLPAFAQRGLQAAQGVGSRILGRVPQVAGRAAG